MRFFSASNNHIYQLFYRRICMFAISLCTRIKVRYLLAHNCMNLQSNPILEYFHFDPQISAQSARKWFIICQKFLDHNKRMMTTLIKSYILQLNKIKFLEIRAIGWQRTEACCVFQHLPWERLDPMLLGHGYECHL